ncbi:hypothetical protein CKG00_14260 (plasmid) [Morganella morganii]|uniref:Uncharacterized protein n=1 Tax=Morganella morganii TaxID=582 RepID=A0A433ZQK6_MORMO|nr:hypothetical protein [Morganella morganii]RUT64359.1 hypothetical protein CKG00_14260 [Morganella morganii]
MADLRYVTGGTDGWLNVKREPAQNIIALPGTLKVDVTSNKNGRDYFTALEGIRTEKYMPSLMISTRFLLVFTIFKYLISRMMAASDILHNRRLPKIGFI